MKRALLIAGGTVGGLGAVLLITPPQLGAHSALGGGLLSSAGAVTTTTLIASTKTSQPANTPAANTPVANTPTPTATTRKAVVKRKHKTIKRKVAAGSTATKSNTPTAITPVANTPTPTQATPTPAKGTPPASTPTPTPIVKKTSGTFVGNSVYVNFGNVQVQITVSNGRITDAQALQAPQGGRSGSISSQAIPMLRQQTLTAQSSAIQGVGGASYTSYGWYTSLQSALTKAGLPLQ